MKFILIKLMNKWWFR